MTASRRGLRAAATGFAWLLVLPWLAWAVVRLGGLERGWPVVPLLAYTPYAAAIAVLAAVVSALLRARAAAVAGGLAAIALIAVVAPRAVGGAPDAAGSSGVVLRVLSANIEHGRASPQALLAIARRERADVLSVQELTPDAVRALDEAGIDRILPERTLEPRPGAGGSGLYARVALTQRPGPARTRNATPAAELALRGARVRVVAVHPAAPRTPGSLARWRADLRALPPADRSGTPTVLAGDFNATLDHAELRRLLGRGYADAADAVGAGLRTTWPSNRRLPPGVTIDHVLADERLAVLAVRVLPVPGSDHLAVFAELVVPRIAGDVD
jgi:endonuclease/exonuclease/phosphatase (EEP) superfamily protein YafD